MLDDPKHPAKVTGMVRMKTIPIPPDVLAAIRAAHGIESGEPPVR